MDLDLRRDCTFDGSEDGQREAVVIYINLSRPRVR